VIIVLGRILILLGLGLSLLSLLLLHANRRCQSLALLFSLGSRLLSFRRSPADTKAGFLQLFTLNLR
jgi:hypothetical protein